MSFMCHHNKCGHVSMDRCNDILNCCHKVHTINVGSVYANPALLKSSFYKTGHRICDESLPSLELKSDQWLNCKGRRCKKFAQAFRGVRYSTYLNHLKQQHKSRNIPAAFLKKGRVKKQLKVVKYKDFIKDKTDDKPIYDEDAIKKLAESLDVNPR